MRRGGYKVVILYIWCPAGIGAFEDESGVSRSYNDANFIFMQVQPVGVYSDLNDKEVYRET